MKRLMEHRLALSATLSLGVGLVGLTRLPFPEENSLLQMILLQQPSIFYGLKYAYLAMLFSTPYVLFSVAGSLLYIFEVRAETNVGLTKLPPYPDPTGRDSLYLVIREVHHPKRAEPAAHPNG